ncbi:hypothetical protein [Massilia sp. S19_KUP03_FR1]|uniref:hypothetical protein n=1 Tax=Massilia sp. S19_KUP03_FR1 TaxID=3025503 RepID=UPI002FCD98C0
MQSTSSAKPLPSVDLVYTKTAVGRHEVGHRGAGLNARQRTALIMLDGQRDARVLETLMPSDQVAPILAALMGLGLIAPAASGLASPAPEAPALAAIKAELIQSAERYLGVMADGVVARVRQAADATELLRVLGHWHMAMQDSKHGKEAARALLDKTRATLA